jgi:hypothetical protein
MADLSLLEVVEKVTDNDDLNPSTWQARLRNEKLVRSPTLFILFSDVTWVNFGRCIPVINSESLYETSELIMAAVDVYKWGWIMSQEKVHCV